MEQVAEHITQKKLVKCKYPITYFLIGLTAFTIGILSTLFDFQELALNERIKVRPGLPAFDMWRTPSAIGIDIGIKVYLFAVSNPHEFLTNKTAKLKLKEIGPIIYRKVLHQEDIVFHEENSTLSFSHVFDMEYDEEHNKPGILNETITLTNPMLLSLAAMSHDIFLARMAFNMIAKDDHVFINRTIYEVLWNNSSPIFDFVKSIPFAVPRDNAGIMFNAFYPANNRYNVNIGPKHGYENFFKINSFNGLTRIDVYNENFPKHCPYSLKGATEGSGLPPHIGKDDVIYAYTKNLCRSYPLVYNTTEDVDGIDAYKFVLVDELYTRLKDPSLDCFKQTGDVMLPNGLSDSSKCALGLPVAVSNPHFWGYHGEWENYIDGLKPDQDNHASYVLVEPTSGVQLAGIARLQSNLPMPKLDYASPHINRFSKMIVPQFWMEYFVINKHPIIRGMVIMFLYLPVIQLLVIILTFALSLLAFYKGVRIVLDSSRPTHLIQEREILFEEQFMYPIK